MNAYLVRIPEEREWVEPILDDGTGPSEPWWPTGIFVAETRGQAKRQALDAWTRSSRSGVYPDDFMALRTSLLERDVDLPLGELGPEDERLWGRVHEVLDHAGAPCDCPVEDAEAA